MNLENLLNKLLQQGKIKKQGTETDYVNGLLDSARQNFLSAKYNLDGELYETAFKSAYDGLLQISRAILLLNGYRPDDGEQHKTTFMVAETFLGEEKEAEGILEAAKEYWHSVRNYLQEKNHQLELFDF